MTLDLDFKRFKVVPEQKVKLLEWDPNDTSGFDGNKKKGLEELKRLRAKLDGLQELLYAEHKHKVLIVLQGMDTSGKDGTIRRVFEGVNPQAVQVVRFGPPTPVEQAHDFLWRVHPHAPGNGEMVIFNRSHYEGVLVERVHKLVPKGVWRKRYHQINDFEQLLHEEGSTILKFFLHIDKAEQKKRLQARLDDPTKSWKFNVNDLSEREFWSEYMSAYEEVLEKTSTNYAPWYIVPSNHGWFRDLLVCCLLVSALEDLHMQYPGLSSDQRKITIK